MDVITLQGVIPLFSHGFGSFGLWKICYIDEPDVVKFWPFHHILIRKYREIMASISNFRLTITTIHVFSGNIMILLGYDILP